MLEKVMMDQKDLFEMRKDHEVLHFVEYKGIPIVIEAPMGSERKWDEEKTVPYEPWQMKNWSYGYVPGTRGNDGDELDIYLGPFESEKVYLAFCYNPDGSFDEAKVMAGFKDANDALDCLAYVYKNNPAHPDPVLTELSVTDFLVTLGDQLGTAPKVSENTANKSSEVEVGKRELFRFESSNSGGGVMEPLSKAEIVSPSQLVGGFEKLLDFVRLRKWSDEARAASAEARRHTGEGTPSGVSRKTIDEVGKQFQHLSSIKTELPKESKPEEPKGPPLPAGMDRVKLTEDTLSSTKVSEVVEAQGRFKPPDTTGISLGGEARVVDHGHVKQLLKEKYGNETGEKAWQNLISHPIADRGLRGLHFVIGQKIQQEKIAMMNNLGKHGYPDEHHYQGLYKQWASKAGNLDRPSKASSASPKAARGSSFGGPRVGGRGGPLLGRLTGR